VIKSLISGKIVKKFSEMENQEVLKEIATLEKKPEALEKKSGFLSNAKSTWILPKYQNLVEEYWRRHIRHSLAAIFILHSMYV